METKKFTLAQVLHKVKALEVAGQKVKHMASGSDAEAAKKKEEKSLKISWGRHALIVGRQDILPAIPIVQQNGENVKSTWGMAILLLAAKVMTAW